MVFIMEVKPRTDPILKMFDPIKFPKEIAFSCFAAAITEAANSGTLVPMAIMVTPITASLTPSCVAISVAPRTNHSDPKYKAAAPIDNHKAILKLDTCAKFISTSSESADDFCPLIKANRNINKPEKRMIPSQYTNLLSL